MHLAEALSQGGMNIDSLQLEPHSPKERLSFVLYGRTLLRTQSPQRHREDQRVRVHGRTRPPAADGVAIIRMEERAFGPAYRAGSGVVRRLSATPHAPLSNVLSC